MDLSSPRKCGSCGEVLAPGAAFCRACGTRYEEPTCDACDAPVAAGTAFCRSCGAPVSAAAAAPPPAAAPTAVRSVSPPPAPPPQGGQRRTAVLVALAILLVGAGAAAAIVLGGNSDSSTTTVAAAGAAPESSEEQPSTESDEFESSEDGLPSVGRPEMEEEITALLLAYHEDVVERDFRTAWSLLSVRKRQQDLAEYGYPKWMRAQASLSDYLAPAALRARIDSLEGEGVARVLVTGMDWSEPGSPCNEWSGLTWVRYEGGEWAYDPGYSTTAARRQEWKSRASELLGGDC
ncbi:MAG TPA: zinc ribbon domain-containing protein [Solirubrobacterales bacterium]|nr:zinc ribbon domain-containing protein [Solirubrobacterales bacterium]